MQFSNFSSCQFPELVKSEKVNPQGQVLEDLAGMAGFEPTSARVKVWCLTAWRHPNIKFIF